MQEEVVNNSGSGRGGFKGNNYNPNYRRDMGLGNYGPTLIPTQTPQAAPTPRKNNNFIVPIPNIPHPHLTYQIKPNGRHGWFVNDKRIKEPEGMGQPSASGPQTNNYARSDNVRDNGNTGH